MFGSKKREEQVLALFSTKGDEWTALDMQVALNAKHTIPITLGRLYVVLAKLENKGKLQASNTTGRTYYKLRKDEDKNGTLPNNS